MSDDHEELEQLAQDVEKEREERGRTAFDGDPEDDEELTEEIRESRSALAGEDPIDRAASAGSIPGASTPGS